MQIKRFADAAAFLERAGAFLEAREAEHALILGVAAELVQNPQLFSSEPPYLATIERGGAVVGAALRTPPHGLTIGHIDAGDIAAAIDALARDVAGVYPDLPSVAGPKAVSGAFAERWSSAQGRAHTLRMALRIHQLTAVRPPPSVPGSMRRATRDDRALLVEWVKGFQRDAFGAAISEESAQGAIDRWLTTPGRGMYLWEDGRPVSSAGCVGPTPHGMRIGAVYTPPELRGRGYASACVAALSQMLLDAGRSLCFLYTDLGNPTSNAIYQRIGYVPVADVDEYAFEA